MSVDRAWRDFTTGDPGTKIAYIEGGINWHDQPEELANRVFLNKGELPAPTTPVGDGQLNAKDYADTKDANGNGIVDPEDIIVRFSDGRDDDHNGYTDDISGWDFYNDQNDPATVDSKYGHANSQMRQAAAETDNGVSDAGVCPHCTIIPIKAGAEALDLGDDLAQAWLYASDMNADVIVSVTADLGYSTFMRQAVRARVEPRHGDGGVVERLQLPRSPGLDVLAARPARQRPGGEHARPRPAARLGRRAERGDDDLPGAVLLHVVRHPQHVLGGDHRRDHVGVDANGWRSDGAGALVRQTGGAARTDQETAVARGGDPGRPRDRVRHRVQPEPAARVAGEARLGPAVRLRAAERLRGHADDPGQSNPARGLDRQPSLVLAVSTRRSASGSPSAATSPRRARRAIATSCSSRPAPSPPTPTSCAPARAAGASRSTASSGRSTWRRCRVRSGTRRSRSPTRRRSTPTTSTR